MKVRAIDPWVNTSYAGIPERLYLIGTDGRVAYKGGIGPVFFLPGEWTDAIESYLRKAGQGAKLERA